MTLASDLNRLRQAARVWIDADPDPETRVELEELLRQGRDAELAERFEPQLEFGTAGLRAVVGAGPARMNEAVIRRVSRALGEYVLDRCAEARSLPIVVGYDARLQSRRFAEVAAAVLRALGIPVRCFEEPVPTPLVAYAAQKLGANAAVVITASHNPPDYNGYKVYGRTGSQIVPPADGEIAARMRAMAAANQIALARATSEETIPDALFERYLMELAAHRPAVVADRNLKIVYTPLHGVGWRFMERALKGAGYTDLHVVREQAEPDGRFPTVAFPNPEEPGALDLALRLGSKVGADLILANDPDADRLAVCVPAATEWQQLTGNEIGILLADFLLESVVPEPTPLVVSSIVSSPLLDAVAAAHGARRERVLTGIKWVYACALELEQNAGVRLVFGYEEALGFAVGHLVRDKDGISAAVLFADLVAQCRANNVSVIRRLEDLYRRYGLWVSTQRSVVFPGAGGAARMGKALDLLAANPPDELAGHRLVRLTDYRVGEAERPRWLGKANLLEFELEGPSRILIRPSGTEPKLKLYVDLRGEFGPHVALSEAYEAARAEAASIAEALEIRAGLRDRAQ
jgi:phosphomannomutase